MSSRYPLWRLLARGLTKRCARCGSGHLFRRWTRMVELCPRCHLRFEREEGHWLAATVINLGAAQVLAVVYLVVSIVMTWPDPPVALLIAFGVVIEIAFSIFFLPFSKTIWQAIELWMRSYSAEDLEDVDRSTYR
ncbi:MAG: DUF983 domain-containing protein [Actinobacteria bacterium]|nr:DUF983 domain-containing protein [Actinomycetota bacterium]